MSHCECGGDFCNRAGPQQSKISPWLPVAAGGVLLLQCICLGGGGERGG